MEKSADAREGGASARRMGAPLRSETRNGCYSERCWELRETALLALAIAMLGRGGDLGQGGRRAVWPRERGNNSGLGNGATIAV